MHNLIKYEMINNKTHKNPININYLEWYMHLDLFLKGHMENYTQNVQTLFNKLILSAGNQNTSVKIKFKISYQIV